MPTTTLEHAEHASTHFEVENPASEDLELYTDGWLSRYGYGGVGVACKLGEQWQGKAIALGTIERRASHCEMYAIKEALKLGYEIWRQYGQRRIGVTTDSVECIENLSKKENCAPAMKEMVDEVMAVQEEFARQGVQVTYYWVHGHSGNVGNGYADKLAGLGSKEPHAQEREFVDLRAMFTAVEKSVGRPTRSSAAIPQPPAVEHNETGGEEEEPKSEEEYEEDWDW